MISDNGHHTSAMTVHVVRVFPTKIPLHDFALKMQGGGRVGGGRGGGRRICGTLWYTVYVHVHNPFVRAWSLNLTDSCVISSCACIKSTLYGHRVVSGNFNTSLIRYHLHVV